MEMRICVNGVFDGSRAMELLNLLDGCARGEVILDFSRVRRFEPFGVEVLVKRLGGPDTGRASILCFGVPPCVAERLREREIVVAGFLGRPRWAPWAS